MSLLLTVPMLLSAAQVVGGAPLSSGAPPSSAPAAATETGSADEPSTDIVVSARVRTSADPLVAINAKSFAVTTKVDNAVFGPVAVAYGHAMPKPIRNGLRNFLANLHEPVVFVNYLLQIKPGKAAETIGRFAINTTVGGAGLFDMAKRRPFYLPRRSNGFANTLGYYGVKPGPFLYLPLIGPTTVRDLFGNTLDGFVVPVIGDNPLANPAFSAPAGALRTLDHRADMDDRIKAIRGDATDPYAASRKAYLDRRQAEIEALHGRGTQPAGPDETEVAPSSQSPASS